MNEQMVVLDTDRSQGTGGADTDVHACVAVLVVLLGSPDSR